MPDRPVGKLNLCLEETEADRGGRRLRPVRGTKPSPQPCSLDSMPLLLFVFLFRDCSVPFLVLPFPLPFPAPPLYPGFSSMNCRLVLLDLYDLRFRIKLLLNIEPMNVPKERAHRPSPQHTLTFYSDTLTHSLSLSLSLSPSHTHTLQLQKRHEEFPSFQPLFLMLALLHTAALSHVAGRSPPVSRAALTFPSAHSAFSPASGSQTALGIASPRDIPV